MGRYSILTNQSIDIDANIDFLDNGWSVSGGAAIHESCNEGIIHNRTFATVPGQQYTIQYTVSNYSFGEVYVMVGGAHGTGQAADGTYTEVITALDDTGISFWSNGDLWITGLRISMGTVEGKTLVFNEKNSRWVGERSYIPEYATKFLDDVLLFRDATAWKQFSNETRNNFFGEQFSSIITFYVNVNPTMVKTLSSIRIVGNVPWEITEVYVRPRSGKSRGQISRITKNRFRNLQGQWFADFLRDLNDPRFATELDKLFKGAVLQGEVARITMEVTNTSEVRLLRVDVLGSQSEYSY